MDKVLHMVLYLRRTIMDSKKKKKEKKDREERVRNSRPATKYN